jgi:lipopolysaccharide exporter
MSANLKSSAVSGFKWSTSATVITSVLQIVYTSIMSRLLDPQAFGIVAISQIIISFSSYLARMGMGPALVQKQELTNNDIRAVFTSSNILSIAIISVIWWLAPYSTVFFDKVDEEVISVIRIMSLSFLVTGLSITSSSLLTRKLRFKELAIIEIASYVVSYLVIGISLALLGYGVWSLVYASLSQFIISAVLMYLANGHSIKPAFRWSYYKPLFAYGSKFTVINFIEFFGINLPAILIGRYLGDYKLGIFRQAFMLIDLPLSKFTISIQKVIFPVFSLLQSDTGRLKSAYLSSISLMAFLIFPLCFGVSAASREIVLVMFGDKFVESIPILSILSVGMAFKFGTIFSGVMCDATARLNVKLIIQSVYVVGFALAAFLFRDFGLAGFAVVVAVGEMVRNIGYSYVVARILDIRPMEYIRVYLHGLVTGLITMSVIWLATLALNQSDLPLVPKLIAQVAAGVIILLLILLINPSRGIKNLLEQNVFNHPKLKTLLSPVLRYVPWYRKSQVST